MTYPIRYSGRLFETTAVEVTSSAVIYTLPDNAFLFSGPRGIVPIYVKQDVPSGTTETLPVLMQANNQTQGVSVVGGDSLTAANIAKGVYLFYFDKQNDVLQIIGVNP